MLITSHTSFNHRVMTKAGEGRTSAFLLLVGLAAAAGGAAFVAQVRPTIAPCAIKVQYTNNRLACAARVFLTRKCTTRPMLKPRALTLIP